VALFSPSVGTLALFTSAAQKEEPPHVPSSAPSHDTPTPRVGYASIGQERVEGHEAAARTGQAAEQRRAWPQAGERARARAGRTRFLPFSRDEQPLEPQPTARHASSRVPEIPFISEDDRVCRGCS
jgi:hypothetical protein